MATATAIHVFVVVAVIVSFVEHSERGFGAEAVALAEEIWKASEQESLEASIKATFEAIRSHGTDSHVDPSHCYENFFLISSCLVWDLNFLTHFCSEFVQIIFVFVRETLHKLFIINAGSGFKMLWKAVKTFLDVCTIAKVQTEGFNGWFLYYGGAVPYRPVEDLAFAVARFYQLGGIFMNYYMIRLGRNKNQTSLAQSFMDKVKGFEKLKEYAEKWGGLVVAPIRYNLM
ncbi:hypothetical protein S83_023427 [Arachis hypogaea]